MQQPLGFKLGFETDALIMREFRNEDFTPLDFTPLYELTRQAEIPEILPDWNMTEAELRNFLAFVTAQYEKFNPDHVGLLLAIEHKQQRRLIGWCGVFPNDKLPPAERELAYAISKDYRNQGYTTEAAKGMVSWIFKHSSLKEIAAIVKPFNAASARVLQKTGFQHLRLIRLSDNSDYNYFSITKWKLTPETEALTVCL